MAAADAQVAQQVRAQLAAAVNLVRRQPRELDVAARRGVADAQRRAPAHEQPLRLRLEAAIQRAKLERHQRRLGGLAQRREGLEVRGAAAHDGQPEVAAEHNLVAEDRLVRRRRREDRRRVAFRERTLRCAACARSSSSAERSEATTTARMRWCAGARRGGVGRRMVSVVDAAALLGGDRRPRTRGGRRAAHAIRSLIYL